MAKVLQRLDILLFANTAQYRREMRDTQDSTTTMFGAMRADAVKLGKVGAAALAGMAAAGTVAVGVLIKEQIELGTEIVKLARISNTGVESMQKLAIAAKAVGVEQDTLGDIYKDTQDKIGDFLSSGGGAMADFFENIAPQVGYTAEQFRELSGPDALQLYYNGLQEANLSQSELMFYMEGIASDASLLIPLLHDAGKGFDVWASAAENAGAVMDEETIRATQELRAANDLMALSYDGAKIQLTKGILPVLSDLSGALVDDANASNLARAAGEDLASGLKGLAKVGIGVTAVFDAVGSTIGGVAATISTLMQGINLNDNAVVMTLKLAKNFTTADEVAKIAEEDIIASLDNYADKMAFIDSLGTGVYSGTVAEVVKLNSAQDTLNNTLGLTGTQQKNNAAAAESAAKASGKAIEAQARLVAITGDSGVGKAHVDFRYARGSDLYGKEVRPEHLSRFQADGKAVTNYEKTSGFGPRNTGIPGASKYHLGTDYATPMGTKITTKVAVTDVKTWYDEKGGGYVSDVNFADGVKFSILHQMPASKSIKGGASGTESNTYTQSTGQADQIIKQHMAEQTRLLEQQSHQRAAIRRDYADEATQIETKLKNDILKISASEFSDDERDTFIADAIDRANIKSAQLTLNHDQKMQFANQIDQTESERITNQYALERREISSTINMDKALRTAKIKSLNMAEQSALAELRFAHERELQQLANIGKTQLDILRQSYKNQRTELDRRTDINPRQKSGLRNALAGAQTQDTNNLQSNARDGFNAQQADMGGYSENYALEQKYKKRLETTKAALDAEVIVEAEAQQAKLAAKTEYETASNQLAIGNAQDIAGSLSSIAKATMGEQSAAFKVMFAVEKGIAIARSIMNIQTALSSAAASLPFPANLGAMVTVATNVAGIIGNIQAVRNPVQGQAHDGADYIPKEGTYFLDEGERVVKPDDNRKLSDFLNNKDNKTTASKVTVNVTNNAAVDVTTNVNSDGDIDMRIDKRLSQRLPQAMSQQVSTPSSPFNKSLKQNYHMQRDL